MDLKQSVKAASLNKSTYINLRWIAIIGQLFTINLVALVFKFEFNFIFSPRFIVFLIKLFEVIQVYFT